MYGFSCARTGKANTVSAGAKRQSIILTGEPLHHRAIVPRRGAKQSGERDELSMVVFKKVSVLVATKSHLAYISNDAPRFLTSSSIGTRFRRSQIATSCDNARDALMPLPQTEMPGRLQAHFAQRGIRMTQQRRAILQVMETATKHLDASQLLRKAQKLDASVDRSTVYRTLQLLKRHGLIDELDLMHIHGEGHYYERKLNRDHIHMACLRCGKIMEFVSDIFEKLKGQVEKDCRFRIVVSRLEIGGYCAACSK